MKSIAQPGLGADSLQSRLIMQLCNTKTSM
jgi:hypothetical protein